jgi:hypothetical protein
MGQRKNLGGSAAGWAMDWMRVFAWECLARESQTIFDDDFAEEWIMGMDDVL